MNWEQQSLAEGMPGKQDGESHRKFEHNSGKLPFVGEGSKLNRKTILIIHSQMLFKVLFVLNVSLCLENKVTQFFTKSAMLGHIV